MADNWNRAHPRAVYLTNEGGTATATPNSVDSSASSVTLLDANPDRTGATIYNDDTGTLYVVFGDTATTTAYTVKLFPDDYYEVPAWYLGEIAGIWTDPGDGAARMTEG
jgi:hypothetical protein